MLFLKSGVSGLGGKGAVCLLAGFSPTTTNYHRLLYCCACVEVAFTIAQSCNTHIAEIRTTRPETWPEAPRPRPTLRLLMKTINREARMGLNKAGPVIPRVRQQLTSRCGAEPTQKATYDMSEKTIGPQVSGLASITLGHWRNYYTCLVSPLNTPSAKHYTVHMRWSLVSATKARLTLCYIQGGSLLADNRGTTSGSCCLNQPANPYVPRILCRRIQFIDVSPRCE